MIAGLVLLLLEEAGLEEVRAGWVAEDMLELVGVVASGLKEGAVRQAVG